MKALLFSLFFCTSVAFGASVKFFNDSPFPLTATIMSADGQKKGVIKVQPQHQGNWQEPDSNAVWSQAPYTVILTCKDGKQYGVITNIGTSATVTAQQSEGDRFCQPEKGKGDQQQSDAPKGTVFPSEQHDLDLGPP